MESSKVEQEDHKRRSSKSRSSRHEDDDAKAKEKERRERDRAARSTLDSSSRSASSAGDRSPMRSVRHRDRADREAKDREAKNRARSGSASRPGASHESASNDRSRRKSSTRNDHGSKSPTRRDEKSKYRQKHQASSVPGVSHERNSVDRSQRKASGEESSRNRSPHSPRNRGSGRSDKKGYHNRGSRTPGARAESSSRDRAHHKKAGNLLENEVSLTPDDNVAPNDVDDAYAVSATIVDEEDDFDVNPSQQRDEARIRQADEAEAERPQSDRETIMAAEQSMEEKKVEEKKKIKKRNIAIVVLLVVIIVGGVGTYFGLQSGNSNEPVNVENSGQAPGTESGDEVLLPGTNTPDNPSGIIVTDSPTLSPVAAVTQAPAGGDLKYPAPGDEECQQFLNDGIPLSINDGQQIVAKEFEVDVDIGFSRDTVDTDIALQGAPDMIRTWLLGPIVGCGDGIKRRLNSGKIVTVNMRGAEMRRLQEQQLDEYQYLIVDVQDIRLIPKEGAECAESTFTNCTVMKLRMQVVMREDESNFRVTVLFSKYFEIGKDLATSIGFSDLVVSFITRNSVEAPDATKEPSMAPSSTPSIQTSSSPTLSTSGTPSMILSESPSFQPSFLPSVAPSDVPSTKPSSASSGSPSAATSLEPTLLSSAVPSVAPSLMPATETPTLPPTAAPTSGPTGAPTIQTRLQYLLTLLVPKVATLNAQAFLWLAEVDTWNPTGANIEEQWIQRYAFATLYYAANGDSWAPATCDWDESEAWMSSLTSICSWFGVTCADNLVTGLGMNGCRVSNVGGTIPTEIGLLSTSLILASLFRTSTGGILPTEIGKLTALTQLVIDQTGMSGSIPSQVGDLLALKSLRLPSNGFENAIPPQVSNLSQLTRLDLHYNSLTGSIPPLPISLTRCDMGDSSSFTNTDNASARGCSLDAFFATTGCPYVLCLPP